MKSMPTISAYQFGQITINGSCLTSDLIIYPSGKIESDWWRKNGHMLEQSDIKKLIDASPAVIIAGTGASGLMKIDPDLTVFLKTQGIKLYAVPTAQAVGLYQELSISNDSIGLCLHLTC